MSQGYESCTVRSGLVAPIPVRDDEQDRVLGAHEALDSLECDSGVGPGMNVWDARNTRGTVVHGRCHEQNHLGRVAGSKKPFAVQGVSVSHPKTCLPSQYRPDKVPSVELSAEASLPSDG